jgi:hypothetical protein
MARASRPQGGREIVLGLRGIEWVILEVENPTKLGIARGLWILAGPGIRQE